MQLGRRQQRKVQSGQSRPARRVQSGICVPRKVQSGLIHLVMKNAVDVAMAIAMAND